MEGRIIMIIRRISTNVRGLLNWLLESLAIMQVVWSCWSNWSGFVIYRQTSRIGSTSKTWRSCKTYKNKRAKSSPLSALSS